MSIALRNATVGMPQRRLTIIETATIIYDQTGHRMADIMKAKSRLTPSSSNDPLECFYGILNGIALHLTHEYIRIALNFR